MTTTRDELSLSHAELIVLSRLSAPKAPSEATLVKYLTELAPAKGNAVAILGGLRSRGLARHDRRALTDAGKHVLRTLFGLTQTPTWMEVRDLHLPALALSLTPGSDRARKATINLPSVTAAVVATQLQCEPAASIDEVCDALIARQLGLPAQRFTMTSLRAHVLARLAGVEAKGTPKEVATRVVDKALGGHLAGKKRGRKELAGALIRQWVHGREPRPAAPHLTALPGGAGPQVPARASGMQSAEAGGGGARPNGSGANGASTNGGVADHGGGGGPRAAGPGMSSQALLSAVREVIPQVGTDGRHGSEKVFVSAIWRSLERERRVTDWSLETFKRWLVGANRDGSLVLARADFVAALDPKQVAESEIKDQGATFHFVLDQRTGGRAHAR